MDRSIQEFDLDSIKPHSCILNLGKRRSGKSYLSRDLIYNHFLKFKKYKFYILISPTAFLNDDYSFIPDEYKFENFSEKLLTSLFNRQTQLIKKYGKKANIDTLLILDDCIDLSNKRQSNLLSYVFVRGRHLKISCLANFQYLKSVELKPSTRQQLDYIFIFGQSNKETIKLISDEWVSGEGVELISTIPDRETHKIMVIDNTINSDNIYWYRAEEIPKNFKIKKPY